jgi:hypothetical protein
MKRMTFAVALAEVLASCAVAQVSSRPEVMSEKPEGAVAEALRRYVTLRLDNADWKEYSQFVTWPDEPAWDCNWVVAAYSVRDPRKAVEKVLVPVVYDRLGLFCYDFEFAPKPSVVTVEYELSRVANVWKVAGPIPDYPDIGADALLRWLGTKAESAEESLDRRTRFAATARKVREAQNSGHGSQGRTRR